MTQHPTPASPPVDDRAEMEALRKPLMEMLAAHDYGPSRVEGFFRNGVGPCWFWEDFAPLAAHLRAEKAKARKEGFHAGREDMAKEGWPICELEAAEAAVLERVIDRLVRKAITLRSGGISDGAHAAAGTVDSCVSAIGSMISPASLSALSSQLEAAKAEERRGIIAGIRHEAEAGCPCAEDRIVVAGVADLIEAGFSYRGVDRMEAEREAEVAAAEERGRKAAMDDRREDLKTAFVAGCCLMLDWLHSTHPRDDLDEAGYDYAASALASSQPAQGERETKS